MVIFLSNGFAIAEMTDAEVAQAVSEAKGLANGFNIGSSYNKLLPTEEDREFIRQNKDKYNLTEDDILDVSRSRFDREVAKGKIEDLNTVPAENLNEKSTLLSIRNDEASKDKSGTTPKEYMDIAVKSDEEARKYQKDLEEKPFLDSVAIMASPKKTLKEKYDIGIDCKEEANDSQEDLEPEVETYQVTTKKTETVEEQKICEESEPVIFGCERNLNLSCVEEKIVEKEANKLDFFDELHKVAVESGCRGVDFQAPYSSCFSNQITFLDKQGVCIKNIPAKITKYWGSTNPNLPNFNFKVNVPFVMNNRIGNWQRLVKGDCTEKICLKWQENYEKKCEQHLNWVH